MENKLCFSVYGELYVVDLDRMLYFEADDHGTNYTLRLPKPVLRMLMEDISGKPQITTTQS